MTKKQNKNQPYEPNHTFSKAPSLAQIVAYTLFVSQALVFYIYIIHNFESQNYKISIITIFTLTLILLTIFACYTGRIDPTDQLVASYKSGLIQNVMSYRQKHPQKILYCQFCKGYVKQKSRHCRSCDRCTQDFDHHCIWLNTCIGSRNYKLFFITIVLTFLNLCIYMLSVSLLTSEVIAYSGNFVTTGFILAWIIGAVVTIFLILLLNLIILHIYLSYKELTTYQFILISRQQQRKARLRQQQEASKRIHAQNTINKRQTIVRRQKRFLDDQTNKQQTSNKIFLSTPIKTPTRQKIQSTQEIQTTIKIINKKNFDIQQMDLNKQIKSQYEFNYQVVSQKNTDKQNQNLSNQNVKNIKMMDDKKLEVYKMEEYEKKQSIFNDVNQIQSISSFNQANQTNNNIDKKNKNIKINKFMAKNASFDLLIGTNTFIQPKQDIRKTIQLDQSISQYKKNQSLILTSQKQTIEEMQSSLKQKNNQSNQLQSTQKSKEYLRFKQKKSIQKINKNKKNETNNQSKEIIISNKNQQKQVTQEQSQKI